MTGSFRDLLDRAVGWYDPPQNLLDDARRRQDRRSRRRRVSAGTLALVVSLLGVVFVWQAFQSSSRSPGFVGDTSWYRVGSVDDLRANRIMYVAEIETFVVAQPGEEPYALSASSPHLGERLLFCRTSGWFFSPAHSEMFDLHGRYELGPASSGMIGRRVRVVGGIIEIDSESEIAPAPINDGSADPEPSGPISVTGTGAVVEDEPGFARLSGDLPAAERFPMEIVEGANAGDTLQSPVFAGAEVRFPTPELIVRLVGVDGSILDERSVSCEGGACPAYAYADLIFSVDAPQRATILFATVEAGTLVWIHQGGMWRGGRLGAGAVIWTLPAASLVHNAEEVLFSRSLFPLPEELLDKAPAWFRPLIPKSQAGVAAWAAFNVGIATALSAWAARDGGSGAATRSFGVVVVFEALHIVDHTSSWITRRSYNPGLVTAWLISLPHALWTLDRLVRDGRLDRRWLRRAVWVTTPLPALWLTVSVLLRVISRLMPPPIDDVGEEATKG